MEPAQEFAERLGRLKPEQREKLEKIREYRLKLCGFDLDDPSSDWMNRDGKDHDRYRAMDREIIRDELARLEHGNMSHNVIMFLSFVGLLLACHLGRWLGGHRPAKKDRMPGSTPTGR